MFSSKDYELKFKFQILLFIVSFFLCFIPPFVSMSFNINLIYFLIIVAGVLISIFNIDEFESKDFKLNALTFLISGLFFLYFLKINNYSIILFDLITNFVILFSSSLILLSFKDLLSQIQLKNTNKYEIVLRRRPTSSFFNYTLWDLFILIVLILLFVAFIFNIVLSGSEYSLFFSRLFLIFNLIFIIDLGVIYSRKRSISRMFHENLIDIISAIPFNNLFQIFKLFKLSKLLKLIKLNSSLKFFSNDSVLQVKYKKKYVSKLNKK